MEKKDRKPKKVLLKNGNPQGDPNSAKRCGATNRQGKPCQAPAMRGKKRCKFHGGRSTGPITAEGLEKSRTANLRHGLYSRGFIEKKEEINTMCKLTEIMVEPGLSHPIILECLKNSLIKGESHGDGQDFLENIDFDKLSFDDKLKIYKKSLSLLARGSKALSKFGAKVKAF